jgi:hypothetical protein
VVGATPTCFWRPLIRSRGHLLPSSGAHINLQLTCSVILPSERSVLFLARVRTSGALLLQSHPGRRLFESVTPQHPRWKRGPTLRPFESRERVCGDWLCECSRAGATVGGWLGLFLTSHHYSSHRPFALLDPGLAVPALLLLLRR